MLVVEGLPLLQMSMRGLACLSIVRQESHVRKEPWLQIVGKARQCQPSLGWRLPNGTGEGRGYVR